MDKVTSWADLHESPSDEALMDAYVRGDTLLSSGCTSDGATGSLGTWRGLWIPSPRRSCLDALDAHPRGEALL